MQEFTQVEPIFILFYSWNVLAHIMVKYSFIVIPYKMRRDTCLQEQKVQVRGAFKSRRFLSGFATTRNPSIVYFNLKTEDCFAPLAMTL